MLLRRRGPGTPARAACRDGNARFIAGAPLLPLPVREASSGGLRCLPAHDICEAKAPHRVLNRTRGSIRPHRQSGLRIDESLREIRGCQLPFGGLSVVFAGDAHQLPPVIPGASSLHIIRPSFFNAGVFRSHFTCLPPLTEHFRQSQDCNYGRIFDAVAVGKLHRILNQVQNRYAIRKLFERKLEL